MNSENEVSAHLKIISRILDARQHVIALRNQRIIATLSHRDVAEPS